MAALEIHQDAAAVARRGAGLFALAAQEGAAARGAFTVALSGGNTPRGLYCLLAGGAFSSKIPWRRVHLYWGDERCVPPDDAASNYAMARAAFIDAVHVPDGNVHRVRGEDAPEEAAAAYAAELARPPLTAPQTPGLPVFDLVLLGLGADGHTASLFPHAAALAEETRLAVVGQGGSGSGPRVTLTFPVINAARRIVFVVTGGEKAGMVAEVLEGLRVPDAIPAQRVAPLYGSLLWLLDEAAAAELSPAARAAARRG